MAITSSRHPPTSIQPLTPPSSSHGARGPWAFAVPIDSAKSTSLEPETSMATNGATAQSYPRQVLTSAANGMSKSSRSNTLDTNGQKYEEGLGYLAPSKVNVPRRKPSGDMGAYSSDPDGTQDFYNMPDNRNGSFAKNRPKGRRKPPAKKLPQTRGDSPKDEDYWIHRDKLKEIESRELEAAGFKVGRSSRSNSRSQSARGASRNRTNSEATDATQSGDDHVEQRRVVSPILAEPEEDDIDLQPVQRPEPASEHAGWDFRLPDEITAEREHAARAHVIRPSTSRIPIAKLNPLPASSSFADRDDSMPRSRQGSESWSEQANGPRVRNGSMSSQVLLDGCDEPQRSPLQPGQGSSSSTASGSPPKSKAAGKVASVPGQRKASATKTQAKARAASNNSPVKRPRTRGGSVSRPGTAHRPEGEAPWVATMYKPDPMLPPDQQIIPTHAKRMQQAQWEEQGKAGNMYDKEFRLLNPADPERTSPAPAVEGETLQGDEQWPLPTPTGNSLERVETGPKSPASEQANYKLTPTIPQSPRNPSRNSGRIAGPVISSNPTHATRVPEPPPEMEKQKEKKACCCIVM